LLQLVQNLKKFRSPLASNLRHPLYRAHAGGQHGILRLLTVTSAKRLAILELKATENPQLPLQAADDWVRVRCHQAQGGLARCGYFPGLQLQTAPPIV
jgi:hypothetical protein